MDTLLPDRDGKPVKRPDGWPATNGVKGQLKRLIPALASQGVVVDWDRDPKSRSRRVHISLSDSSMQASDSAPESAVRNFAPCFSEVSDSSDNADSREHLLSIVDPPDPENPQNGVSDPHVCDLDPVSWVHRDGSPAAPRAGGGRTGS